VLAGT